MPSEPASPILTSNERRLHPLSWLFVLLAQLRQFAVPLIVLVLAGGRGDRWELVGALGVLVLPLIAVAQYFSYRFRIADDELIIRSGIFQRNRRHIPFRRIHNVSLHQNLLHRAFGVAEVHLESAGGVKPEAQMRVLSLADAHALEALVQSRGNASQATTSEAITTAPATALLSLPTSELLRLGLISNRGMVVVAAGFGVLAQSGSQAFGAALKSIAQNLFGWANGQHLSVIGWLLAGISLFIVFAAVLRVLSMLLAILQFHGFTLHQQGQRLSVEAGLLTRIRAHTPRHRIQAWTLHESLLQRWLHRQSLSIDSAVIQASNNQRSLRDLAPIAPPHTVTALLQRLLPAAGWPDMDWQPLHPRAWRRMLVIPSAVTVLACAALWLRFGNVALFALLALPWWWLRARRLAKFAGYALSDSVIVIRGGWPGHYWRLAEISKLQVIGISSTPFDRRHDMATLWLDTAGATAMQPRLRIRYLPNAQARALLETLNARMQRSGIVAASSMECPARKDIAEVNNHEPQ
jgi:putative membrane protein